MTALEAGCRQTPEKGTAIGISGTVFTSQHVNITDPDAPPPEDHDSLSTGAIIGIAVAVIVTVLVAVGLLLVYCHKKKSEENWEDYYYDAYAPQQPQRPPPSRSATVQRPPVHSLPSQPKPMADIPRTTYLRHNNTQYPDEKPKAFVSSGDYYDSIEKALRNSANSGSYPMKELDPAAAHSTGTLHSNYSACSERSISRGRSRTAAHEISPSSSHNSVAGREPSPPADVHRVRSNTPDSYVEQVYLDSVAEEGRKAAAAAASVSSPTASSVTSPGSTKRRSILTLMSLSRISGGGGSKKDKQSPPLHPHYILQPQLTNDKAFHGDKNISRPILARREPRFLDANTMSSASAVVSRVPRPPTPPEQNKYAEYKEVPLKSGKSALYGI